MKGHNWGVCRKCGKNHGLPPFSGKHHSKESKRIISEANQGEKNPNYGKRPSEKSREKMSEAKKGEKQYLYGKHHSPETREKMSKAKIGKKNHFYGKHHSEETKKKISIALKESRANGNFGGVFTSPTVIEVLLREFLDDNNIPYSTRKVIDIDYKIRHPDVFIEPNIIIEADGKYFHGKNVFGDNRKAEDEKDDKILKELGYFVYRIPEVDFRNGKYLETLNRIIAKQKP